MLDHTGKIHRRVLEKKHINVDEKAGFLSSREKGTSVFILVSIETWRILQVQRVWLYDRGLSPWPMKRACIMIFSP